MGPIRNLRWWIAGLLALATALNYLDRQTFPVLVGEIQKEIPLSHQQYGRLTEFNLADVGRNVTDADGSPPEPTPATQLWENLDYFLNQVLPVAEEAGIRLALHPDDPPLPELLGQPRIIISNEALQRVVDLAPSPANGVCYCVGSLYPAGVDVIAGIRGLAKKTFFVHARNVRGTATHFTETWHDNGDIDMPAVIRTLHESGYHGTLRPDHAPSMAGESNETPGYEMLGRLYAAGYLRGLMQAVQGRER